MKSLFKLVVWCVVLSASSLLFHTDTWAGTTVSITDMVNRTVQVPARPERIICVSPGTLRLICYLGAQDKLVGVERFEKTRPVGRPYWLANPQLAKLPTIGPGGPKSINGEPDLEAVMKVRPEIIFISYMDAAKAEALQDKLDIPVVVLTYGRFATFDPVVYQSLRVLGKILGKEERAEAVVSFIESARKDLRRRIEGIPDAEKPIVYVGAIGYKGFQGIESTDSGYVPLEWVQARNVAKKAQETGHLFIDKEKLISWDPAIIFIDAGGFKLVQEDFRKKPEFYKELRAIKNGSVYLLLPFNWYMTNIGTAIADAYTCGKILFPEKFADVDPAQKADEIYTFFVGRPVYSDMMKSFGNLGARVSFSGR